MAPIPVLKPIAQCRSRLFPDEAIRHPFPVPAINGVILVKGTSDWFLDHELSADSPEFAKTWTQLFRAAHSELSWFELLEVIPQIVRLTGSDDAILWSVFGFRCPDPRLLTLAQSIPAEARRWMSEKNLGPMDLSPLLSFESPNELQKLALFWPQLENLSRQDGVKALELWVELVLTDSAVEELLLGPSESSAQWLERLKSKRFPQATSRDLKARQWLEAQSWPRGWQLRWQRQGDQSGIELKVNLRRSQDLASFAKNISALEEKLKSAPEALWPKT